MGLRPTLAIRGWRDVTVVGIPPAPARPQRVGLRLKSDPLRSILKVLALLAVARLESRRGDRCEYLRGKRLQRGPTGVAP